MSAYQSAMRQWIVREGTTINLPGAIAGGSGSGSSSPPGGGSGSGGSGGGQLPGETYAYKQHLFSYGEHTLSFTTVFVSQEDFANSAPRFLWQVVYAASADSSWRIVVNEGLEFKRSYDLTASGFRRDEIFTVPGTMTAALWSVFYRDTDGSHGVFDQYAVNTFGFEPRTGQ